MNLPNDMKNPVKVHDIAVSFTKHATADDLASEYFYTFHPVINDIILTQYRIIWTKDGYFLMHDQPELPPKKGMIYNHITKYIGLQPIRSICQLLCDHILAYPNKANMEVRTFMRANWNWKVA